MTITSFATVFFTDQDEAVEFDSVGFEVQPDVSEYPDDQLSAAIRLVQKELGGIVVS